MFNHPKIDETHRKVLESSTLSCGDKGQEAKIIDLYVVALMVLKDPVSRVDGDRYHVSHLQSPQVPNSPSMNVVAVTCSQTGLYVQLAGYEGHDAVPLLTLGRKWVIEKMTDHQQNVFLQF